jgi:hypothetical protein
MDMNRVCKKGNTKALAVNNSQMLQAIEAWQQLNFVLNFTNDVID